VEFPLADVHDSWPVVSSELVYDGPWVLRLYRDELTTPRGGEPFERVFLGLPGAAAVVAIDEDDRVLVVRQYRHAAQRRMVELPAGVLDVAGEDPLDVARRELREEAGYVADEWRHLISAHTSPGVSQEVLHYFVARGLHEVGHGDFVREHEEADMEIDWVPYEELVAAVLAGRLGNGVLVTGLLTYDALRRRGGETP
jgi:ADP-ribose pyrophosphatase